MLQQKRPGRRLPRHRQRQHKQPRQYLARAAEVEAPMKAVELAEVREAVMAGNFERKDEHLRISLLLMIPFLSIE